MFMVKDERANTAKLLKVKARSAVRNFQWFFIIGIGMCLLNLIPTVVKVIRDDLPGATSYSIPDHSISFFIGLVFAIFFLAIIYYRQINDYLSIFPQTNNSRFISSQLLNYFFTFVLGVTLLAMYLCEYAVFQLMLRFKEGIFLALNFDIGFAITGLFTFLMYGFLIVALFGLIGVIIRKWRWYVAAFFVVILSLVMLNPGWFFQNLFGVFAFITKEPAPVLFFLKGIAIWLVLTALSLLINRCTVYYKSQVKLSTLGIVLISVIAVVAALIVPAFTLMRSDDNTGLSLLGSGAGSVSVEDPYDTTRIDVSHLPKGSKVNIEKENVVFSDEDGINYSSTAHVIAFGAEALDNLQGDTIVLRYREPLNKINGYEMAPYTHPKLTADLDGSTLRITYTIDDAQIVFLPIWGFAKQFDCYAYKGLLLEYPWGSSGGFSGGNLEISVE